MAAGAARIRITYQVDADGLLSVSARELRSNVEASITVKPSYGLGDDEVARMLQESYASADEDMKARALREEQVEAERIMLAAQSALEEDGELLSAEERAAIDALMVATMDVLVKSGSGEADHYAVKAAYEALARGTEEFASRRMDRSVRKALSGKTLDQVV
jgi:molecular chaperone HscA